MVINRLTLAITLFSNRLNAYLRWLIDGHQAPPSSSQPKLPDHQNIPLDRHLSSLATQTKGGARLSLLGLHVRNQGLG